MMVYCKAEIDDIRTALIDLEILKENLPTRIESFHDSVAMQLRNFDALDGVIAEEMIRNLRDWVDYSDFKEPLDRAIDDNKSILMEYCDG